MMDAAHHHDPFCAVRAYNRPPQPIADGLLDDGLYIDNFAGGGGASTGIEMALGRSPDVAINHDAEAVALHALNHPDTLHLCQNVWKADPIDVVREASVRRCAKLGIPFRLLRVRGLWFSPDCKHFSKAKGSKPVEKGIRDLAWVVVHWVKRLQKARVPVDQIWLENVEEFKDWGPLILTDDGKRVPCPVSKGLTFKRWCRELRKLGGKVEWRELRAFRYGAPTIRKRLFVIVRFDGKPIVWPAPTHEKPNADGTVPGGLLPWRTAAECIDWSIPCPSIFTRERPLAENTMRRIARGIMRYVVNAERPFIVGAGGPSYGGKPVPVDQPFGSMTTENRHALVAAFLAQHNTGNDGHTAEEPVSTIVGKGCTQGVVAAHLVRQFGTSTGSAADAPVGTIMTDGGGKTLLAASVLSPDDQAGAERVAAFIAKYYGQGDGSTCGEPLHSVTTKDRFGLVTVNGWPIADIGMRMLQPRELYRAQGFPDSYIIDGPGPSIDGKPGRPLTKTAQVRMCGNSVCPPIAAAIVAANVARVEAPDVRAAD